MKKFVALKDVPWGELRRGQLIIDADGTKGHIVGLEEEDFFILVWWFQVLKYGDFNHTDPNESVVVEVVDNPEFIF